MRVCLVVLVALLAAVQAAVVTFPFNIEQVADFDGRVATTTPFDGVASFTPRLQGASASIGNTVWQIGGLQGIYVQSPASASTVSLNDVHVSHDSGHGWVRVTASAPWSPRYGHNVVAYVVGGTEYLVLASGQARASGDGDKTSVVSDSWVSTNGGLNWDLQCYSVEAKSLAGPAGDGTTKVFSNVPPCRFQARGLSSMRASSDGTIIMVGGYNIDSFPLQDVWRSKDHGRTWTQLNGCVSGFTTGCATDGTQVPAIFAERYSHATTILPNGKLLIGGGLGNRHFNDVWVSSNVWSVAGLNQSTGTGTVATWSRLGVNTPGPNAVWSRRFAHRIVTVPCLSKVYLAGGVSSNTTVGATSYNDVWVSSDNATTWQQVLANGAPGIYSKREYFNARVTDKELVVFAGVLSRQNAYDLSSDPFYADVWAAKFAGYVFGNWSECSCPSGEQTRTAVCISGDGDKCCDPADKIVTRACSCWQWSNVTFPDECPVDCGESQKVGNATCYDVTGHDNTTYDATEVPWELNSPVVALCGPQPEIVENCFAGTCSVCNWTHPGYTPCSASCGNGIRQLWSEVECLDQFNNTCLESECYANDGQPPVNATVCATDPCPKHVIGDPEFLGFQGQKFEIHGIPDQVFNIITSPLMQYNALFVFLGKKSAHVCNKTRTHPWTHAGTYLGSLGFKTIGGDRITMHSGSCVDGIKSVVVNGETMSVGDVIELSRAPAVATPQRISFIDMFTVKVELAEVTLTLTNSDSFFNQEVAMTAYGEEVLQLHGLLGQTWRSAEYVVDGVKRVIDGVPTDYLVQEESLHGDDFVFNRFKADA